MTHYRFIKGVSCVILSFNEEMNISQAIETVKLVSDDIWVIDSGSTDATREIAESLGVNVVKQPWLGFSRQWNFALQDLPLKYDYVMLHASDEQIPDKWAKEFRDVVDRDSPPDLIQTRFEFWWLGKAIRYGGYGKTWIVKAGKRSLMKYMEREVNEHIPLQGVVYQMKEKYIHRDRKEVGRWLEKHILYARLEALERKKFLTSSSVMGKLFGAGQGLRTLWIRQNIYDRLPLFVKPAAYFTYRYFFRLGFLDGVSGTYFHFLHAFWYPMMIDLFSLDETSNGGQCASKNPK